jgi:hypothetical protein
MCAAHLPSTTSVWTAFGGEGRAWFSRRGALAVVGPIWPEVVDAGVPAFSVVHTKRQDGQPPEANR